MTAMTVKELKKELEKYDENTKVYSENDIDGNFSGIIKVDTLITGEIALLTIYKKDS